VDLDKRPSPVFHVQVYIGAVLSSSYSSVEQGFAVDDANG